jgi:hypothetical protein
MPVQYENDNLLPSTEYKGFRLMPDGWEVGYKIRGRRIDDGLFTLSLCGDPREYLDTLVYETLGEALREAHLTVDLSVRPYPYASGV